MAEAILEPMRWMTAQACARSRGCLFLSRIPGQSLLAPGNSDYGSPTASPMAQDVWEAFHQNSETTGPQQDRKYPLRRRPSHWNNPKPPTARTGKDSHVARPVADLASVICPASNVRICVCLLSSTPPETECCDNRLNPPIEQVGKGRHT